MNTKRRIQLVQNLYNNPGSEGEKQAAFEALIRLGAKKQRKQRKKHCTPQWISVDWFELEIMKKLSKNNRYFNKIEITSHNIADKTLLRACIRGTKEDRRNFLFEQDRYCRDFHKAFDIFLNSIF